MKAYFLVAIEQHIERGQRLLDDIENSNIPPEYFLLAKTCKDAVVKAIEDLKALRDDPEMQLPDSQSVRLRRFRRSIDQISALETTGVMALQRRHKDDIFLNRLIQRIRDEIQYPLLPPTVAGLSTNYFYILNDIKLLFVPLIEGNYLLHLPDLYHELAHPLLYDTHNSKVKALQSAVEDLFVIAAEYIEEEMKFEQRRIGPNSFAVYLYLWQKSWWKWAIEFFCDLFAVFTVGPAFAWSNIHLCMKSGDDPFFVPTRGTSTHPADDARMRVILKGLAPIGFGADVPLLQEKWQEYIRIADANVDPLYKRCFPDEILEAAVRLAYNASLTTGCRIAKPGLVDPIHCALNDAWSQFWSSPNNYTKWEKQKIEELRQLCGV